MSHVHTYRTELAWDGSTGAGLKQAVRCQLADQPMRRSEGKLRPGGQVRKLEAADAFRER